MGRILILSNHFLTLYLFRQELIERLKKDNHEIYLAMPSDDNDFFKNKKCNVILTDVDRHGMNPLKDFKLFTKYYKIIKKIKPSIILSFTIKPNIYGGIASKLLNVDFIPNITGLGTAMNKNVFIQKFLVYMYRLSFDKQKYVFVQNESNKYFMENNRIKPKNIILIPGSGVDLKKHHVYDYPNDNIVKFFFIARVMKDKGIEEFIEAAQYFKKNKYNTEFHILGFCEDEYEERLKILQQDGVLIYHGMCDDLSDFQKINSCTIHPSYHEGMSNVLLETSAHGRPSLCSNIPGCKEIIDDGVCGYLFESQNAKTLIQAIKKFLKLSWEQRKIMGLSARKKVEKEFDRNIVINTYLKYINKIEREKR